MVLRKRIAWILTQPCPSMSSFTSACKGIQSCRYMSSKNCFSLTFSTRTDSASYLAQEERERQREREEILPISIIRF